MTNQANENNSLSSERRQDLIQECSANNTLLKAIDKWKIRWKTSNAYLNLLNGKKFTKAFDAKTVKFCKENKHNPIEIQSRRNIRWLAKELIGNADANNFAQQLPSDNERLLYLKLIRLPWLCQHATDSPTPILEAKKINSYKELCRHNSKFKSLYTTERNITGLSNTDFVFFRVFVEGENGEKTRYGHAKFHTSLALLLKNGWISLHDQEAPFGVKKVSRYRRKNLRKGRSENEGLTLQYSYYGEKGKPVKDEYREISFLREIFYGPDILPGIALSFIYELRQINKFNPAVVYQFFGEFKCSIQSAKSTAFLGEWIREFFRIEGKVPIRIEIEKNNSTFITSIPSVRQYKKLTLTKDETALTEKEHVLLGRARRDYAATRRNPIRSNMTYLKYYRSLIVLIKLNAKQRERELVLHYVNFYLQKTPHTENLNCENGQSLAEGLTALLLNEQISLSLPMRTKTISNRVSEPILHLEFILTTHYFDWLLNNVVDYKDIKNVSLEVLTLILELFSELDEHFDMSISQLIEYLELDPDFLTELKRYAEDLESIDLDKFFKLYQEIGRDTLRKLHQENKSTLKYLANHDINGLLNELFNEICFIPKHLLAYLRSSNFPLAQIISELPPHVRRSVANDLMIPDLDVQSDDDKDLFLSAITNPMTIARVMGDDMAEFGDIGYSYESELLAAAEDTVQYNRMQASARSATEQGSDSESDDSDDSYETDTEPSNDDQEASSVCSDTNHTQSTYNIPRVNFFSSKKHILEGDDNEEDNDLLFIPKMRNTTFDDQ